METTLRAELAAFCSVGRTDDLSQPLPLCMTSGRSHNLTELRFPRYAVPAPLGFGEIRGGVGRLLRTSTSSINGG